MAHRKHFQTILFLSLLALIIDKNSNVSSSPLHSNSLCLAPKKCQMISEEINILERRKRSDDESETPSEESTSEATQLEGDNKDNESGTESQVSSTEDSITENSDSSKDSSAENGAVSPSDEKSEERTVSSAEASSDSSTEGFSESSTESSTDSSSEVSSEPATESYSEASTEASSESSMESSSDTATAESNDSSTEASSDTSTEASSVETSSDASTESSSDLSTEASNESFPESSSDSSSEVSSDFSTEASNDTSTEASSDSSSEVSSDSSTEASNDTSTEVSSDSPLEVSSDSSAESSSVSPTEGSEEVTVPSNQEGIIPSTEESTISSTEEGTLPSVEYASSSTEKSFPSFAKTPDESSNDSMISTTSMPDSDTDLFAETTIKNLSKNISIPQDTGSMNGTTILSEETSDALFDDEKESPRNETVGAMEDYDVQLLSRGTSLGCLTEDREKFKRGITAAVYSQTDGEPTMLSFHKNDFCIGTLSKDGRHTLRSRGILLPQLPLNIQVEAGMFMHNRLYLFDSSPDQRVWSFKYEPSKRTYSLKSHSIISTDAFLQVCGIKNRPSTNFRIKAVAQFSLNDPTCIIYDQYGGSYLSQNPSREAVSLVMAIQYLIDTQYLVGIQSIFAWLDEPFVTSVYLYGSNGELYELYRKRSDTIWPVGNFRLIPYEVPPLPSH